MDAIKLATMHDNDELDLSDDDLYNRDRFIKAECVEYWLEVDGQTLSGAKLVEVVVVVTAFIDDDKVLEPDKYEYVFEVAPSDPSSTKRHLDVITKSITPEKWHRIRKDVVTDPAKHGYVGKRGHKKGYEAKRSYPVYVRRIAYKER